MYSTNVMKSMFIIMLVLGVGAMFVIPSPVVQVAKASICNTSVMTSFSKTGASTGQTSGSCSGSISGGGPTPASEFASIRVAGGLKSSCAATSMNNINPGGESHHSNGAVSCSAHSP